MEREAAKQYIKENWRTLILSITTPAKTKVNRETSYICPICGHGKNGDGLTFNKKSDNQNGLICFGCGFKGDIIDLYQQTQKTDFNTAFSLLANELNITIDTYKPYNATTEATKQSTGAFNSNIGINTRETDKSPQIENNEAIEAPKNYINYYKKCMARLNDPEAIAYLNKRGISLETAKAYWIGYDPEADPANNAGGTGKSKTPCKRLIIPTTNSHYIARRIDDNKQYAKMNPKHAAIGIFNLKALYAQDVQAVFVTEGALDALSIIEAGAAAIGLNSASNKETLLKQLETKRTKATLILCLDNDDTGERAAQELQEGLKRLNISYITANICKGYKDPNEALTSDKTAFIEAVQAAQRQTATRPDNVKSYIDLFMKKDIEKFKSEIKTGYANLDEQAGGLYAGLYCIAAISSLGKTTFAAQMADQIAAAGQEVLFFSLEQSRLELVSKSIARTTAKRNIKNAVTSLAIRKGNITQEVQDAAKEYIDSVKDRISVIEGNFNCNISFISDYIRNYIKRTNTRPVIFIDYLQILQGDPNANYSTREMIDNTVTQLKRISRENELTVFIISSVNRANYLTPIDFESLKESGGIEYTCDVIWGLQLECLNDPIFDKANNIKERREKIKEAKAATPRKIELSCLKNRYGVATFSCFFDYYPANDLFKPTADPTLQNANKKVSAKRI